MFEVHSLCFLMRAVSVCSKKWPHTRVQRESALPSPILVSSHDDSHFLVVIIAHTYSIDNDGYKTQSSAFLE